MIHVDVETTGLDPRASELRVVAIDGVAYDWWGIFDPDHPEIVRNILDSRKDETFVAHNAQFDLDFLEEHVGFRPEGMIFDTMVAWQVLQCGRRAHNGAPLSASLDNICQKVLGVSLDKSFQKGPWDGILDDQMLAYAGEDTHVLVGLREKLEAGLRKAGLWDIFRLEMQLLPILLESKRKGVLIDVEGAKKLAQKVELEAKELEKKLPPHLNPRAPAQVSGYFGLPSSDEDTLKSAYHQNKNPLLKMVMDVRKLYKKKSSIEKQILGHVSRDGRIHTSFKQTFTETGRLSSSQPNLQNQDRSAEVRGLFIPEKGKKFVIADYGQLEVRVAALVSRDKELLKVFRDPDSDIHAETCRGIFGEPNEMESERKKTTRTLSKNILFGSLFGGGHNTVIRFAAKQDVIIPERDAKQYQAAFFDKYPQLKRWHQKAGDLRPSYVYSILGRRRYIEPGEAYCTRINNRIQSTAADGMKLAMVMLYKLYGILPLLSVHDEIIVEVDEKEAEEQAKLLKHVMEEAMYRATKQDPENPIVPMIAEVDIGTSWADKS